MQLNLKSLNALKPSDKLVRTTIKNHALIIEQKPAGLTILFKYKSPINNKTRLKKILSSRQSPLSGIRR
ncbi:MAG: hypothetical protein DRQ62_00360 [Gammaproteobacteria bacterium]|nr:MAG: hypothetical protein DRQ62_00360 [Gammaproteobacteria bacterium]